MTTEWWRGHSDRTITDMKKIIIIFFVILLSYSHSWATDINCSSSSTVQTAINNAANGDTIRCNASGSYNWSSTVTVPNSGTKGITLDGGGATISAHVSIMSSATYNSRVTGFHFTSTGSVSTGNGYTNKPWRIDNCVFTGSGTLLDLGNGPGLIDHSSFPSMSAAQETMHIWGWGDGNTTGWTNAHTPGSPNAIYMENNSFVGAKGDSTCAFQMYYGGRVVARYNTLNQAMFEVHGTGGQIGGRWWEFYNNAISNSATLCLRAGSGVIFGNTRNDGGTIYFTEEDSGYPAPYQVGRGQSQILYPAYVWDSGVDPWLHFNQAGCAAPAANMVLLDRDVYKPSSGTSLPGTCTTGQGYWKTDEGGNWDTTNGTANDGMLYKCTATNTWTAYYTPYTYPHPLTSSTRMKIPAAPIIINPIQ